MQYKKIFGLTIIFCISIIFYQRVCYFLYDQKNEQDWIHSSNQKNLSNEVPKSYIQKESSVVLEESSGDKNKMMKQIKDVHQLRNSPERKGEQLLIKPVKKPDMQALQNEGITYEMILKKHSGKKDSNFQQINSGYDIPDDKWEDMLTLYTTIQNPSNEQEQSIKAGALLDMAASKLMSKDYQKARQALNAVIDNFPGTEEEQKACKGLKLFATK
ncbi:MAG: hypothetical protein OMM_01536 [Candidatus Magnetoglobus multicellularis str. Araruama]|uniref:Tetratricopeptide repeat protein n=1 Tax=Candidatus Magnetoglobus multicellularis str. Araruama TaxID=890399 RepID=A0A1V1PCM4_9BACT|nr:MAG: hypothetical protein OMM_01536 [Candidatus Magnetoglobus multicellularis str. Araruama]